MRVHLILSKQLTREEGLNLLKEPIYNENDLNTDLDFFIKKLDLTEQEFERIMNEQPKSGTDYPSNIKYLNLIWKRFIPLVRKLTR